MEACAEFLRRRVARWKLLRFSRQVARRCGRDLRDGLCTIDEVTDRLRRFGHLPGALGSTAGSVFRNEDWHPTCLRVRSRRPEARGREVKVWQFVRRSHGGGRPRGRRQAAASGLGIRVAGHVIGKKGSPPTEPLFSCKRCGEILPVAWSETIGDARLCVFCFCKGSQALLDAIRSPGEDPDP
jgi:hypothetical protein